MYIIVIYVVITVDYYVCILLFSPLNSYLDVHWILNKYYYYYLSLSSELRFMTGGINLPAGPRLKYEKTLVKRLH